MKALITGITGQDGYFLSKLLLSKGYEVHGIVRRNSQMTLGNLELLPKDELSRIKIHYGDITDPHLVANLLKDLKLDELYHLAAQTFVSFSFQNPTFTYHTNIIGTLNIANAIKDFSPKTKLYFAATSELFGNVKTKPQNENTPFMPNSPYSISKLAGYWTIRAYREAYGLFACNGILFNHESELRGPEFVTRHITLGVAKIAKGSEEPILLGNLNSRKDWGYSPEYVKGMWMMLQQSNPDDYVLATNEQHTVRDFVEEAFRVIGKDIEWRGKDAGEYGVDKKTNKVLVRVDKSFFRPIESENFLGDYSKAKAAFGWEPKTKFKDLVKIMVDNDLTRLDKKESV